MITFNGILKQDSNTFNDLSIKANLKTSFHHYPPPPNLNLLHGQINFWSIGGIHNIPQKYLDDLVFIFYVFLNYETL